MPADHKLKQSSKTSAGRPIIWPWRQLVITAQGTSVLKNRNRVKLSRHLLNLRLPVQQSTVVMGEHQLSPVSGNDRDWGAVNFLKPLRPQVYSLTSLIDQGRSKWAVWSDLSLWFLLEIIVFILDVFWLAGLAILLRLHQESHPLAKAIWLDIKNFFHIIALLVGWPLKIFKQSVFKPAAISLVTPKKSALDINLSATSPSQVGVFFLLLCLIILPLKGWATWQDFNNRGYEILNLTNSGFRGLEQAGSLLISGDPILAQNQLVNAQQSFTEALSKVSNLNNELAGLLSRLPVTADRLENARLILAASQEITKAVSITASTMVQLNDLTRATVFTLGPSLEILSQAGGEFKSSLQNADAYLSQVRIQSLPPQLADILQNVRRQLSDLEIALASVLSLPQLLEQILVTPEPKIYLVLFQNSTELRPTGGFAGSLALIEVSNGEVRSVNIPAGGPYDWQGSLQTLIRPPEPLRLVRGTWQLQDANWFFDFPTSAAKIKWFLEQAGGPELSGVIALNSDVVIKLLKLTGPVELPQYGKVLTADNFMRETQAAVEIEYDRKQNRPKQFIADLAPVLFSRLLEFKGRDLLNLIALINTSLLKRDLQLYSVEPFIQAKFEEFGWAGRIESTPSDYLAIVRTNIGGGKTDRVITEQIRHQVVISPQGELTVHLSLTRRHLGDPYDTFEGRRNVSYLRFYVPDGSILLSTDGFTPPPSTYYREVPPTAEYDHDLLAIEKEVGWETTSGTRITEEYGKTVFANWLSLSPGESRTVSLTYRLPFRLFPGETWQDLRRYSILFQRQSGMGPVDFISEVSWPQTFRLRWQESSRPPLIQSNKLEIRSDWQMDEFYGLILEKL